MLRRSALPPSFPGARGGEVDESKAEISAVEGGDQKKDRSYRKYHSLLGPGQSVSR